MYLADTLSKAYIQYCLSGWPRLQRVIHGDSHKFYIRDELYVTEGILFANERILAPEKFKPYMLKCIHEGHIEWKIAKQERHAIGQSCVKSLNSCSLNSLLG